MQRDPCHARHYAVSPECRLIANTSQVLQACLLAESCAGVASESEPTPSLLPAPASQPEPPSVLISCLHSWGCCLPSRLRHSRTSPPPRPFCTVEILPEGPDLLWHDSRKQAACLPEGLKTPWHDSRMQSTWMFMLWSTFWPQLCHPNAGSKKILFRFCAEI